VAKRVYKDAYASVRFFGDALDPLTVSLALRLPSDHSHRAGEPHLSRTKSGEVREYAAFPQGLWLMSSREWVHSPRLAAHVEWLLDQLEPKAATVASLLEGHVHGDISCYSFGSTSTPPSIPKGIRDRATALGLEIVVDHYTDGSSPSA
jgi:hypothetical protein